jgi:dipeptidyl aminopeptidase/acylaminoacyl peptidase
MFRAILKDLLLEGTNVDPLVFSIAPNIRTQNYSNPPTYIITGNADTKVPHQQSLDVVQAHKDIGSFVEYHELDGLDHGFDHHEDEEMDGMYEFLKRHV